MTLHLLALAPAAVGLCCLAADRRRARAAEVVAAMLMMMAMVDAAVTQLVPAVWWVASLLAGAMALAATRGRARVVATGSSGPSGGAGDAGGAAMAHDAMPGVAMAVHSAAGMVVMAALLLAMSASAAGAGAAHHHSGTPAFGPAAMVLGGGYVVASAVFALRSRGALERAQYAAMAGSVALMAAALVG